MTPDLNFVFDDLQITIAVISAEFCGPELCEIGNCGRVGIFVTPKLHLPRVIREPGIDVATRRSHGAIHGCTSRKHYYYPPGIQGLESPVLAVLTE